MEDLMIHLTYLNVDKGKYLFHEGDTGKGFYIILKGKISISRV